MRIKLLRDWGGRRAGQTHDIPDHIAATLVDEGVAVVVQTERKAGKPRNKAISARG